MQLIDVVPLLIGVDGNIANLRTKVGDDCMLNKAIDLIQYTRDYIAEQTIVDAVPVVRCKDCKHFNVWAMECQNDAVVTDNEGGASFTLNFYLDDFCSYGERRADNGDEADN